jgi:hypothetical protein
VRMKGVRNLLREVLPERFGAPVDVDGLRLADAVRARHGLQVILGVPVRVEDNHLSSRTHTSITAHLFPR